MKKLFIIFAILCLAAPAMAAEWDFYGSARMATWRTANDIGTPGNTADDDDSTWALQGNSRIGSNVKFNDQIGGRFEAGISSADGWTTRMMYGTYNFGNSELLFGQTYTPTSNYFYSNQVYGTDNDLFGTGQFYAGRNPMVQWKWNSLKIALVTPNAAGTTVAGVDDTDVDIPKLEAAYKFKTDMFFIDVFGGYQTYTLDGADKDYDIDSYVVGLGGGLTMGPVYFNAGVHMGQNLGNYGASGFMTPDNATDAEKDAVAAASSATYNAAEDKVTDNDGLGYLAVLGFNISEMFTVEAGYGYTEYEPDVENAQDVNAASYYINCVINIAPGFFIVPEIGKVEYEANTVDLGDFTYYGAKWQINF